MTTCMEPALPDWIPTAAQTYLAHVVGGASIRALARDSGCHASTILRQVRRFEQRRDDFLVDNALTRLGRMAASLGRGREDKEKITMTAPARNFDLTETTHLDIEGRQVLARLSEPGACLAVAAGMEKAVVVRETADGQTLRTGVVDVAVAEGLALRDWISTSGGGKVARYRITRAGRAALKRMVAEGETARLEGDEDDSPGARRRARYGQSETPLALLARRKEKDGQPFLSRALIRAGERLREDFELARMGPDAARNWDEVLSGGPGAEDADPTAGGAEGARARVEAALRDLGPGLGDVVLRVCCYTEGLESVEKRMGWAARSGKIVLRIGLQHLVGHYDRTTGKYGPMIG